MAEVPPQGREGSGATPAQDTLTYDEGSRAVASPTETSASTLGRGSRVHRYTILDRVGEGGMGVVYAAYDPGLDRRVALKFLRSDVAGLASIREKRLLREAQAMARLSHPNVAVVYDVGTFGGHVFLSMEFVDGMDLRAWLTGKPRSRAEILDIFRAVGRGLAAAHAAGIIHCDFKPENVLVDRHDRPRVTDFGVSRTHHEQGDSQAGEGETKWAAELGGALATPNDQSAPLTRTGGVIGTPSYMAPEQHRGEEADARADQFSFCVSLHEALMGARPFAGEESSEMLEAMENRRVIPGRSDVPRWLRAVVLRGLEPDKHDRWPGMQALLDALGRDHRQAMRRRIGLGAAFLGLAAIAGAVATRSEWSEQTVADPCPPAWDKVATIWDPPTRQTVRSAFVATGAPQAVGVFNRVAHALEARLSTWVGAHREACQDTRVRGEQSDAMLDLRMQCLERARRQIAALPEIWRADVKLDEAVKAALTVGELERCSDSSALGDVAPRPRDPDRLRRIEALQVQLDRVAMLERAEHFDVLALSRRLVTEARALGYAPVTAEALFRSGRSELDVGDGDVGFVLLYEAFRLSSEVHNDRQAAEILISLIHHSYHSTEHHREVDLLWRMAEAAVARVPHNEELTSELLHARGVELGRRDRNFEAVEQLRRALEIKERMHADEFNIARVQGNLAMMLYETGRWDEGLTFNRRAQARMERSLGPDNPRIAYLFLNDSDALAEKGDYEGAVKSAERALAIFRRNRPADHKDISTPLRFLGAAHQLAERYEEAQTALRDAERILSKSSSAKGLAMAGIRMRLASVALSLGHVPRARQLFELGYGQTVKALGEQDWYVAWYRLTLGGLLVAERDLAAARATYKSALDVFRRREGPHPEAAYAWSGLGEIALAQGHHAEAIVSFEGAKKVIEGLPDGSRHPVLIAVLTGLGRSQLQAGHRSEAISVLERAVQVAGVNRSCCRVSSARAEFHLARALWARDTRRRATELARRARAVLAPFPDAQEIDRWLQRHRGAP